jgi:hypothetical protein
MNGKAECRSIARKSGKRVDDERNWDTDEEQENDKINNEKTARYSCRHC